MKAKKLTALLLCLMFLLSAALFSCNKKPDESQSGTSDANSQSNVSGESSDTASKYKDKDGHFHPTYSDDKAKELIGDKKEFRVLVYDNTNQSTYYSEEIVPDLYKTTDPLLSDAVKERNNRIFEKTGIEVKAVLAADVYDEIQKEIQTKTGNFDAAMPFLTRAAALAQTGAFYDLKKFEEKGIIDLEAPWYDQNANDTFSVNNRIFFTVSDMSVMQKITSFAVSYNPDLIKNKFPEIDMYKLITEKKWTLDKMYEIGKAFYEDTDGNGVYDFNDNWGCSGAFNDARSYYLASGQHLCTKDEDDSPIISIGDGKSVDVATKILDVLEKNDWILMAEDMLKMNPPESIWKISYKIFGEGKTPFRNTAFSAIKKLRDFDINYSVAPIPLIDEEQETYHTPCIGDYAYGIVIPATLSEEDADFTAYMIDLMSAGGKEYIVEAYYEQILKKKDALYDPSQDINIMDEYVFSNVAYDIACIYGFEGLGTMLTNLIRADSTDITSSLEAIRDQVQVKIDDIIDNYKKLP